MAYRCFICHRPPRGFCWLDSNREKPIAVRRASFKRFCSKMCQDIHYQMDKQGVSVNKTDLEKRAIESVLPDLADYVVQVGMNKGLGHYSKQEIIGLVEAVLESYHTTLQTLYHNEVPF